MSHARKWLWLVALAVGTGCGGSVDERSAEEELRQTGAERCQSACEAVTRCSPQGDCSCPADPGGGPCTCEAPPPGECVASCSQTTRDVVERTPACADELLSMFQCVERVSCTDQRSACAGLQDALENCTDGNPDDRPPDVGGGGGSEPKPTSPPVSGSGGASGSGPSGSGGASASGGASGSGAASGSGGASGVTCRAGSGSAGTSGNGPLPPGAIVCESGWGDCSDGQDYKVSCTMGSDGLSYCACVVNGLGNGSGFVGSCPTSPAQVNTVCGWRFL